MSLTGRRRNAQDLAGRFTNTLPSRPRKDFTYRSCARTNPAACSSCAHQRSPTALTLARSGTSPRRLCRPDGTPRRTRASSGPQASAMKQPAESEKLHPRPARQRLPRAEARRSPCISSGGGRSHGLAPTRSNATHWLTVEVRAATRRLNRLVDNLLDQTRLESGRSSSRLDWCDAARPRERRPRRDARERSTGHPFESKLSLTARRQFRR